MGIAEQKIQNAGDVTIEDVTIITSNRYGQKITPQVLSIEIYEDIFAPFITGNLIVRDSQELTNLLPLVGEEMIQITVSTPSMDVKESYSKQFMIYKMSDRFKLKDREVVFQLHFISREAIIDLNKNLSQCYEGKISEIAQKIYKDGLQTEKKVNIETTSNKTKFIANYWNPVKCLQFVADQALNDNGSPSYVFYENKYGFHFLSLETLYTGTPIKQRFVWDNYSRDNQTMGGSTFSIDKDYQRIIDFVEQPTWNYMERLKSGMYGSQIVYMDLLTHQYVHVGYQPDFAKQKHLNEYPLWSSSIPFNSRAVLTHEHQYYNAFDGYGDVSNTAMCQQRRSVMAQAEGYKITINVLGRCDYHAGQRVYLEVPRMSQLKPDDPDYLDKLTSGNYLIGAICHSISREKHSCSIQLIKDSYMREIK